MGSIALREEQSLSPANVIVTGVLILQISLSVHWVTKGCVVPNHSAVIQGKSRRLRASS